MFLDFEKYYIAPIAEKDAWKLCDFVISNTERLKRYFPKTLAQNLTPDLSNNFTVKKAKQFQHSEEFLFKLKEKENRTIVGLIYLKALDWEKKKAELAYCIGYEQEGKGWMTASVEAISNYAFTVLELQTLQILVHKSNMASIRVAKKCGYFWQRTLSNEHTPPGEDPLDMELYEKYA